MQELSIFEVGYVSGGAECKETASLRNPIPCADTDTAKLVNSVARGLNDFGGWLGRKLYDATH